MWNEPRRSPDEATGLLATGWTLADIAVGYTSRSAQAPGGAEECYVLSGSLFTWGRRLGPGDFLHADANTDHTEMWTDEGCQVLLVVPPEDYLPEHAG